MKKYLCAFALLAGISNVDAQQLQTSSLYDFQGVLQNPSMAGIGKDNMIGVSYRSQWSGIAGSPKTTTVFGSFNLPKYKIGISGYLYNDQTGPTSRKGIQLAYAKHIVIDDNSTFSLGIEARMLQFSIDKGKLGSLGTDPVLGASSNSTKFDAGFGISYTNKNFQVGASASQLTQSKMDFYSGNLTRNENAKLYRHYYFHGNYKFNIDGTSTLTPTFLMTYLPNAPIEFQAGARFDYNNIVWFGGAYRINQGPMFSAGVNLLNKFSVGYCFDIYSKPLSSFTDGSMAHEIMIKYTFSSK